MARLTARTWPGLDANLVRLLGSAVYICNHNFIPTQIKGALHHPLHSATDHWKRRREGESEGRRARKEKKRGEEDRKNQKESEKESDGEGERSRGFSRFQSAVGVQTGLRESQLF